MTLSISSFCSLSNESTWKEYELDPKEAIQYVEAIKEDSTAP
jgi:hypothetical protein